MRIVFKKKYCLLLIAGLYLASLGSCKNASAPKEPAEEPTAPAGTPVTVTTVSRESLVEYTELNATSAFLQKSYVKANVNGYITEANVAPGKYVAAGQSLFVVKTKEAQSIGTAVDKLDPSFKFSGVNHLKAGSSGYITQLNHVKGDYVQDGEQLAVISDISSFAFILALPYDLKRYVKVGDKVDVLLADGNILKGTVSGAMPTVDAASQTQNMVIKVSDAGNIPENLVARVKIVKMKADHVVSLPKAAVLTNDAQTDFWIMKVIDSATAVKIPVKKGAETKERIEIVEPKLDEGEKILLTGNFGLPDTAKIVIGK